MHIQFSFSTAGWKGNEPSEQYVIRVLEEEGVKFEKLTSAININGGSPDLKVIGKIQDGLLSQCDDAVFYVTLRRDNSLKKMLGEWANFS